MSKITAIVISYNEKNYIRRAIDSITSQSADEIEIIIGDDGSSDGSIELISQIESQLTDSGISVSHFVMQRPKPSEKTVPSFRVSSIIKKALSMATGEYCAILSADDVFCDNSKFSDAVSFLDAHKDYSSYVSGFRYTNSPEEHIPEVINTFLFWGHFDYYHISCFVFRKFDPELLLDRFSDDTGLVYTILKQGKCKDDSKVTFEYTQRDESIMHSSTQCELLIIEAMILQDVLNDKSPRFGFRFATKSREFGHIRDLYANRHLIKDGCYSHYLENSGKYSNNIAGRLADTTGINNRLWSWLFYLGMAFDHYVISVLWRIARIFRKS